MKYRPSIATLPEAQVDLYLVDLQATAESSIHLRSMLSSDEIERADRFVRPLDAQRFTVARAGLRTVVGWYAGVEPANVEFTYGKFGKPALNVTLSGPEFSFNVSHSGGFAAIGVCRSPIGIDLEFGARIDSAESLAGILLSPAEAELLENLKRSSGPAKRVEDTVRRFVLRRWTLKEAYLKGIGEGLSVTLREIEFQEKSVDSFVECPKFPMPAGEREEAAGTSAEYGIRVAEKSAYELHRNGKSVSEWTFHERSFGDDGSLAIAVRCESAATSHCLKFHTLDL